MSQIEGVIQAGGKGTRLYPITLEIPKPLLTIGRRPIVQHLVDLFRANGISAIHVIVNQEDLSLFERWNKEYENENVHLVVESERLGTWGGIRKHLGHFTDTFLVSNGDELKDIDIQQLLDTHREKGAQVTLGTVEVENPSDYGVVESDMNGLVSAFQYKPTNPTSKYIMAGVYAAEPTLFSFEPTSGQEYISFEEEVLPKVIKNGNLYE
jgi:mannose-1-phosphate guanylyltransferase